MRHRRSATSTKRDTKNSALRSLTKSIRKLPFLYLGVLLVLVAVIAILSSNLAETNHTLSNKEISLTSANKSLKTKANELSSLQTVLSKTTAGQAELQSAESQANQNAASASQQASAAEAQSSREATQLDTTQSQLSSANAKLASVQACVSLFNSVIPNIKTYSNDMNVAVGDDAQSGTDLLDYLNTNNISYLNEGASLVNTATSSLNAANGIFPGINSTLQTVSSGNCG